MTAPPGPPGQEQLQSASPARVYLFPSGAEIEGRQARGEQRSPHYRSGASERRWLVSNAATHWAWKTPVRGVRQHVLLALADRANKNTGQCSPSLSELSDMTGLGQSTIRGHIRALELDGLITVKVTNGGRRQRSTYTLMVTAGLSGDSNTPQLLGGIESKTPQQRAGKKSETPQHVGGIDAETPQELATYPPAAGGVVLRTKTRKREPVTTPAADASAEKQPALFKSTAVEKRIGPNAGDAVAAWVDAYTASHDARPTARQIGQVGREARQLLEAGNPPDRVIAVSVHAGNLGWPTLERQYRDQSARRGAQPAAPARPSTTDSRVSAALALADRYEMEAG